MGLKSLADLTKPIQFEIHKYREIEDLPCAAIGNDFLTQLCPWKTPAHYRSSILGRILQTGACTEMFNVFSALPCVQSQARASSHRRLPPLARPRPLMHRASVEARLPWLAAAQGSQRCLCTAGKGQGSTCAADPHPERGSAPQGKQHLTKPWTTLRLPFVWAPEQWPSANLLGHAYRYEHRTSTVLAPTVSQAMETLFSSTDKHFKTNLVLDTAGIFTGAGAWGQTWVTPGAPRHSVRPRCGRPVLAEPRAHRHTAQAQAQAPALHAPRPPAAAPPATAAGEAQGLPPHAPPARRRGGEEPAGDGAARPALPVPGQKAVRVLPRALRNAFPTAAAAMAPTRAAAATTGPSCRGGGTASAGGGAWRAREAPGGPAASGAAAAPEPQGAPVRVCGALEAREAPFRVCGCCGRAAHLGQPWHSPGSGGAGGPAPGTAMCGGRLRVEAAPKMRWLLSEL